MSSLFQDADATAETPLVTPVGVDSRLLPLLQEVGVELTKAMRKFPPFNSPHEGWAVIYEEFHKELGEHVWNDTGHSHEARQEAIQTAAMALRYVVDLVPLPDPAKFVGELLTEPAKPEEAS